MSLSRHAPQVRAVAVGFSSGYGWKSQASTWGQLVRAPHGVLDVRLGSRYLVLPPGHALWIPPGLPNEIVLSGAGVVQRVYVRGAALARLPRDARPLSVTPLLREVLRRMHRLTALTRSIPAQRHLIDLFADEFTSGAEAVLTLPLPRDPRALRAAEFLKSATSRAGSRRALARRAQASVRTLERLFRAETGISLGAWERRARLIRAMALLAGGQSVTAVGIAVGYASTSAFVAAFRRLVGLTPKRYAASARGGEVAL